MPSPERAHRRGDVEERRSSNDSDQGAEQELLVDQPYEDSRKIRVSGRFTVESLSPHRNLEVESTPAPSDSTSFVSTILDNLRASGVQNTFKGERLAFDMLEPYRVTDPSKLPAL